MLTIDEMFLIDDEFRKSVKKAEAALELLRGTPVSHKDRVKNLLLLDEARGECFKLQQRLQKDLAERAGFASYEEMITRTVEPGGIVFTN